MIIELERSADDTAAEAAEVGVPACEDMELELQASPPATPQASSLKETEFRRKLNDSSTPKKEGDRSERNRSVESEGKTLNWQTALLMLRPSFLSELPENFL